MLRTILAAGTLGQVKPNSSDSPEASADLPQLATTAPSPQSNDIQTLNLPPLPDLQATTTDFTASLYGGSPEAGLALASILGGIQPSYFGGPESETQGIMFEDLGGSLSAMDVEVDWDGLEKSMRAAEEAGGQQSVFNGAEWQGYFGGMAR